MGSDTALARWPITVRQADTCGARPWPLWEHRERQGRGVRWIVMDAYAGNYQARQALEKAGYRLAADSEAVLRAYYIIPEDRKRSSGAYQKAL